MSEVFSLGVDIGTTSLSTAVINAVEGTCIETQTIPAEAFIPSSEPYEKIQDTGKILRLVKNTIDTELDRYPAVSAIGFSGQMHGIVYGNENGEPVSPLYTWQDGRAAVGDISICSYIRDKTGYDISSGYGLATHCYNMINGETPVNSAFFCTVHDLCVLSLCGLKHPVTHPTDAASLGLYDVYGNCFRKDALDKLGIKTGMLPEVVSDCIAGYYRGIPVSVPLGDNQASFIGAVSDEDNSVLCNLGTGSQISMVCDSIFGAESTDIEVRPFIKGKYLLCGSALCGGRAYAILENFMRSCGKIYGGTDEKRYDALNVCAEAALDSGMFPHIRTSFCGRRSSPDMKGMIEGLTEENFTPGGFAAGISFGMVEELYGIYRQMSKNAKRVIISGNAGRRNPAVCKAAEMLFGTDVVIPEITEEAAYGAAMYSAAQAGLVENLSVLSEKIKYRRPVL